MEQYHIKFVDKITPRGKRTFISLSSLALAKFLSLCTCTRSFCALMTRKSCALGMRNAILRNHLNASRAVRLFCTFSHCACYYASVLSSSSLFFFVSYSMAGNESRAFRIRRCLPSAWGRRLLLCLGGRDFGNQETQGLKKTEEGFWRTTSLMCLFNLSLTLERQR